MITIDPMPATKTISFDTPERGAFRKTLRDFVAKEIKPNADTWDEVGEIPWDLHQRVGALSVRGFGIEE